MRFLLIFVLALCAACDTHHHSDAPLKLGTNQWPGYELLYLARTLNFHDKHDIKLVEMTSATDVMNAFSLGRLDIAALTLDEVLQLAENHDDLRVFLVMDISNGADQMIATPDITNLEGLKGKTIAVEKTALGAFFLSQIIQAAGISNEDISVLPTTVDQHMSTMMEGKADAVITFEPSASNLVNEGFQVLFDSSQIPGKIVDVLVTRESVFNTHHHQIEALLDAHWQALSYISHYPDKAYEKIAPRLQIEDPSSLAGMYAGLILPNRQLNQALLNIDLPETGIELMDTMHKEGLLSADTSVDMNTLFTTELVE